MSEKMSAEGKVVEVLSDDTVVVNRGSRDAVSRGDRFLIYGLGKELSDPDTGESLGTLELVRGVAEATHVQDRMSTLQSAEWTQSPRQAVRKVHSKGRFGALDMFGPSEVVEEELAPRARKALRDVQVGDSVRPI